MPTCAKRWCRNCCMAFVRPRMRRSTTTKTGIAKSSSRTSARRQSRISWELGVLRPTSFPRRSFALPWVKCLLMVPVFLGWSNGACHRVRSLGILFFFFFFFLIDTDNDQINYDDSSLPVAQRTIPLFSIIISATPSMSCNPSFASSFTAESCLRTGYLKARPKNPPSPPS